jgi:hypothetical protein
MLGKYPQDAHSTRKLPVPGLAVAGVKFNQMQTTMRILSNRRLFLAWPAGYRETYQGGLDEMKSLLGLA